jgi:hypothetical protein
MGVIQGCWQEISLISNLGYEKELCLLPHTSLYGYFKYAQVKTVFDILPPKAILHIMF